MTFIACALSAYGPALGLFILFIAPHAVLVIIAISRYHNYEITLLLTVFLSAFFWLVSALISAAIVQSTSSVLQPVAVFVSVLMQEVFRYAFYRLFQRAEKGLLQASQVTQEQQVKVYQQLHSLAAGNIYISRSGLTDIVYC